MERLAKAIILADNLYWGTKGATAAKGDLYNASDAAARAQGFDNKGFLPIYLLLKNHREEILNWANSVLGIKA